MANSSTVSTLTSSTGDSSKTSTRSSVLELTTTTLSVTRLSTHVTTEPSEVLSTSTIASTGSTSSKLSTENRTSNYTQSSDNTLPSTPKSSNISNVTFSNEIYTTRLTTVNLSTKSKTFGTTDFTKNDFTIGSSTSNADVGTNAGESICASSDECKITIGVTVGVAAAVVVLVILTSLLCFLRMRKKWKRKIKVERQKTDLWSAATYNNTIINDNFMDYKLASPGPVAYNRDSSEVSFAFDYEQPIVDFSNYDSGTLRRNTYSAPDNLPLTKNARVERQVSNASNEYWLNQSYDPYNRGRSSTFTTGKKFKLDRHVLLKHEEHLDRTSLEQLSVIQDVQESNNPAYVTEL